MRIILAICLVFAMSACGSKKGPQSPANQAEPAPEEEKSMTAPEPGDEAAPTDASTADPCEGGE